MIFSEAQGITTEKRIMSKTAPIIERIIPNFFNFSKPCKKINNKPKPREQVPRAQNRKTNKLGFILPS